MTTWPNRTSGFTLAEVLIATVTTSIIVAATYALFTTHYRMATIQEEKTLMQQELLAASSQIADELRMCGYSPTGAPGFGFAHMPSTGKPGYGRATNETSVYCTLDSQADGKIDESGSGSTRDHVGFRINVLNSGAPKPVPDNVLRKYDTGSVHWQPLCTNIGDLRFRYFDDKGQPIHDPPGNSDRIRMVEIRITAVPSARRIDLGIGNRTVTTRVLCRNLGMRRY